MPRKMEREKNTKPVPSVLSIVCRLAFRNSKTEIDIWLRFFIINF